jgi:hypothetical protein
MVVKRQKSDLIRTEIRQVDFTPTCPILIDSSNRILFGNSVYNALPDTVDCVVFDSGINHCFLYVEKMIIEAGAEQWERLDREVRYCMNDNMDQLQGLLFDMPETGVITAENYIYPKDVVNYLLVNRYIDEDDENEGDEDGTLFSVHGTD